MPVMRGDAIGITEEGYRAVLALLSQLDDARFAERGTIGGGEWSAKDLAGHPADWEEYALRTLEEWRRGVRPWFEDVDTDEANDEAITRHRDARADAVRERCADLHERLRSALAEMSDDEWAAPTFYETERPRSLGELLGAVLGGTDGPFRHPEAHLAELRHYVSTVAT